MCGVSSTREKNIEEKVVRSRVCACLQQQHEHKEMEGEESVVSPTPVVRTMMRDYWEKWSHWESEGTDAVPMKLMLLEDSSSLAHDINVQENAELLSRLPDLSQMRVLELGAGIGRLTKGLASRAKHVTATDLMEKFVRENEATNGPDHPNVTFHALDATQMNYPAGSFDLVFSNWLLMYLSDKEVDTFLHKVIDTLAPGGYLFFRESCYYPSGHCHVSEDDDPSRYRSPKAYHDMVSTVRSTSKEGQEVYFDFIHGGNSQTYVHHKGNPTQIYWLWRKCIRNGAPSILGIQQVLDNTIYSPGCIDVYERIIGDSFTTPGGLKAARELLSRVSLKPGMRVLDVGSGLGGAAIYLAQEFEVFVTSVEISMAAVQAAILKQDKLHLNKIHVCVADLRQTRFPDNYFDLIFVRETVEYISSKAPVLTEFLNWLKPGAKLLLGDYCLSHRKPSPAITSMLERDGLELERGSLYMKLLEDIGFTRVSCINCTDMFIQFTQEDLKKLVTNEDVSVDMKAQFTTAWRLQLSGLQNGELGYVLVLAAKPVELNGEYM